MDPDTNKIIISRDVAFIEDERCTMNEVNDGEMSNDNLVYVLDIPDESQRIIENSNPRDVNNTGDVVNEEQNASHIIDDELIPEPPELRRTTRIRRPVDRYVSCVAISDDPLTLNEALSRDDRKYWESAVNDEYNALIENKTWSLATLPEGRKPISCKWTFKIKHNDNGTINRYKARLVAKGFSQRYGLR